MPGKEIMTNQPEPTSEEVVLKDKLIDIQDKLKAPKSQLNKFGGYEYRSCEDILNALKPLLVECFVILTDDIVQVGDRYYVKATASLSNGKETISTTAYAREEETKKGMDASQITGSASSYARKYALNGLFAIDDTKDADSINAHDKNTNKTEAPPQQQPQQPTHQSESHNEPAQTPLAGKISENQTKAIFGSIKRFGVSEEEFKVRFGVEHISELTKQQASDIISKLFAMKEW